MNEIGKLARALDAKGVPSIYGRAARRGFVFSVDSMLSLMLITVFATSIAFFSSQLSASDIPLVDMQKKAGDTLVLLDKLHALDSMNSTAIGLAINQTAGTGLSWKLVAEYYNYSVVGSTASFTLNRTITLGGDDTNINNVAAADRAFVVRNSSTGIIDYYGRARLEVWTG